MATEVATGIPLDDSIIDLNDEFITIDETDGVRRRPSSSLESFIRTQVGTRRDFGNGPENIVTWAEGDDVNTIPIPKVPHLPTSHIIDFDIAVGDAVGAGVVRTTGNQHIGGVKNFDSLQKGGVDVATTNDLRNQNTSPAEPSVFKFWTGTETEYQALLSADMIDGSVIYHRRSG